MDTELLAISALIFFARVIDVSLGTLRMIFVMSGMRLLPAALGFIEIVIWVVAIGNAVANLSEPLILLGYAGGFSVGTMVGAIIEERVGIGFRIVTVVNPDPTFGLAERVRQAGFAATEIAGEGGDGSVEVVIAVVRGRRVRELTGLLSAAAPRAFTTIERADRAVDGVLDHPASKPRNRWLRTLRK